MNRPLSGTLMDPLIHLIAAESSIAARLCEPLRAWGASGCLGRSRGGHRRRAVSEERRGESDPHPSHRPSRRRASILGHPWTQSLSSSFIPVGRLRNSPQERR